MLVVGIAMASVNSTRNSFFLTIKIFFLLISLILSASSLVLAVSMSSLSFTNYIFAVVSLRISFPNVSLLQVSISFDEAGALPLSKVNMPLLSNVSKQYEQEQSTYNDHCLRSGNQGVQRQMRRWFTAPEMSLYWQANVRQVSMHCRM